VVGPRRIAEDVIVALDIVSLIYGDLLDRAAAG